MSHLARMADADSITRLNAALDGRYRIEREIGAGGMSTVYLAEEVRHQGLAPRPAGVRSC